MRSSTKKLIKFLSSIILLSNLMFAVQTHAKDNIERSTREYSLSVGEKIQSIKDEEYKKRQIAISSSRELKCLTDNVYYEAGNQSVRGKMAVAAVTMNRVNSGKFPSNVCSVVYQKSGGVCQFSWVCFKKHHRDAKLYAEAKEVARKVLTLGDNHGILNRNVLFYHADYVNPRWNLRRVTKIGDHIFYAMR